MLTNDLKVIVTSGAYEIDSYIVIYVNVVKAKLGSLVAYVWIN